MRRARTRRRAPCQSPAQAPQVAPLSAWWDQSHPRRRRAPRRLAQRRSPAPGADSAGCRSNRLSGRFLCLRSRGCRMVCAGRVSVGSKEFLICTGNPESSPHDQRITDPFPAGSNPGNPMHRELENLLDPGQRMLSGPFQRRIQANLPGKPPRVRILYIHC